MIFLILLLQTITGTILHQKTPLNGVNLFSDSKPLTITSSDGKFYLNLIEIDSIIVLKKKNFETLVIPKTQLSQSMIIYMRLSSLLTDSLIVIEGEATKLTQFEKQSGLVLTHFSSSTNQQKDYKKILNSRPEIEIQESSGQGAAPIYKGFRANKLLYIVDGVRFNNAFFKSGNTPYISLLNPLYFNDLSAAEGSVNIAYGSDALGGSLNFKHNNLKEKSLFIQSSFTSAESKTSLGALAQYNDENSLHSISIYSIKSGNRQSGLEGNNEISTKKSQESTYRQHNLDYSYTYALDDTKYAFSYHFAEQREAMDFYRTFYKGSTKYDYDPLRWNLIKFSTSHNITSTSTLLTAVYFQTFKEEKHELTDSLLTKFDDEISVTGLNMVYTFNGFGFKHISGMDLTYELSNTMGLRKSEFIVSKYPNNATQLNTAVYLSSQKLWNNQRFTIGTRLTRNESKIPNQYSFFKELGPINSYDKTLFSIISYFGYTQYFDDSQFDLSYSTSFRNPNFDDLSKSGEIKKNTIFLPSYKLEPETSQSLILNFITKQKTYYFDTSIVYTRLSNLIEAHPTMFNDQKEIQVNNKTYTFENNQNIGRAELFSLTLNHHVYVNQLSIESGLSYQYGQDLINYRPLSKIPPFKLLIASNYSFSNSFHSRLSYTYAAEQNRLSDGDLNDPRIPPSGTPAYHLWNVEIEYKFDPLKLNIEFENLFDQRYRSHSSALNGRGRGINIYLSRSL